MDCRYGRGVLSFPGLILQSFLPAPLFISVFWCRFWAYPCFLYHSSVFRLNTNFSTLDQLVGRTIRAVWTRESARHWIKSFSFVPFSSPIHNTVTRCKDAKLSIHCFDGQGQYSISPFTVILFLDHTSTQLFLALLSSSANPFKDPFFCFLYSTTFLLFEVACPEGIFHELAECWSKAAGSQVIDDGVNCTWKPGVGLAFFFVTHHCVHDQGRNIREEIGSYRHGNRFSCLDVVLQTSLGLKIG